MVHQGGRQVATPLAEFENPPVIEVALAVGFQPLSGFRIVDFGLLWAECYREAFPKIEVQAPTAVTVEQFRAPAIQEPTLSLQFASAPGLPRVWYLDPDETQLVQVQNNWFARNWRRMATSVEYPHYDKLRGPFGTDLTAFVEHGRKNDWGEFKPVQCELSYFNHITIDPSSPSDLSDVLSVLKGGVRSKLPFERESTAFSTQGIISKDGAPAGRLYVKVEPALRRTDLKPIVVLSLTAKGRPLTDDIEGVLSFLDLSHELIVRTFEAVTTAKMHVLWGKK